MLHFEKTIDVSNSLDKYIDSPSKTVFFDIETTGLHHKYSYLYMIGVLYQHDGIWTLRQWFATRPTDEITVLTAFMDFLQPNSHLIHYNGGGFDIPYLKSRLAFHGLTSDHFDNIESIDLYRLIKPYQKKLALERLTQKSVEQFIGITRTDPFSGKELIDVYKEYLQSGSEQLLSQLLLHNQEDVLNMSSLISLLAYPFFFDGHYAIEKIDLVANTLVIHLNLEYPIIRTLTYRDDIYTLTLNQDTAIIKVPLYHGTLKHFYDNPKDYYYLPAEDKSIHKSVATYVDKEHRVPAVADNCYQKITGTFIPQYGSVITPNFSTERKSKLSYFACDNIDFSDPKEWQGYINHLLQY